MKRFISVAIAALLLLPLVFVFSSCENEGGGVTTLYVYNWGEYISDGSDDSLDSNAAFEEWYYEEYGEHVKVNYSTFSSNEDLYAKISSGTVSYDVIVPSDYMIERMINEDMLVPLNYENIPNVENLSEDFFGEDAPFRYYDPENKYSVPYFYGVVGVIYNTEMVDEDCENIGSWNLMWDEDYKGDILQFNNSRDAFGTAMYKLGLDVNSDNEEDWRAALEELKKQKNILQGYVMDEIYNKMENGSAAIATYYAGDFFTMYEENEALDFFYPEEGTNLYIDAMCIPKGCQNQLIAERYIDFMLSREPAVANAEYTYYASPNKLVYEDEEYQDYMEEDFYIIYPQVELLGEDEDETASEDIEEEVEEGEEGEEEEEVIVVKVAPYKNLSPEKLALVNNLWEELKSDMEISVGIYVICIIIVVTLAGLGIFFGVRNFLRKKKYS